MTIETKILCDHCNTDLTYSRNSIDYRLGLINQNKPSQGGFVTDMMMYPILDRDKHFCGMICLKRWVEAN